MSSFRIRPRFKHEVQGQLESIEKDLLTDLKTNQVFKVTHLPGHIYVRIPSDQQHMWSPQLHLTLEQEEGQVIIRGLYGPNPTLWVIFFFGYSVLGIFFCFLGMWGFSKWSLGMDSSILWALPVIMLLAMILYFSAQAGQKLGAQEMFDIHHWYESLMDQKISVH